jgi:23S rRNA (guanosine2251-2'-O)-methyltransferase
VNSSAGASEHLLIARNNLAQTIAYLKKQDIWVIGLEDVPEAASPAEVRVDGGIALVVGGEGSGMRQLVRRSCDVLIRLPMRGKIHSYNAAVAGSIAQARQFIANNPVEHLHFRLAGGLLGILAAVNEGLGTCSG